MELVSKYQKFLWALHNDGLDTFSLSPSFIRTGSLWFRVKENTFCKYLKEMEGLGYIQHHPLEDNFSIEYCKVVK